MSLTELLILFEIKYMQKYSALPLIWAHGYFKNMKCVPEMNKIISKK